MRWGNNNNYNQKRSNFSNGHSFGNRPQHNKPQDSRQGKQWGQKSKDSKITLTQESAHFMFHRVQQQFLQAVRPCYEAEMGRTEKQERNSSQVNEITEGDLIQAFGVTEDQMEKAAAMLGRNKKTKKSGNSSA